MSAAPTRLHDQIVDLLTKAHTEQDSMETRVQCLQQAMEFLLYHNSSNERIDEFLETFLSMHLDKSAPIRRFCAHFVEMLVFTRSRFACSCLEVLVTLLQDTDKQVVIFSLRAARVVYKRALYWISVQQRESVYVHAARESVQTLDHVLARVVHLITSSTREVFCESIRCAQSVVLCQSFSAFAPKSLAQLETAGCSSLEDLKLVDASALDEGKLKAQADRLFTALCALLVKNREDGNAQMETVSLIHAVGVIGHERSSYVGAATVAFMQVSEEASKGSLEGRVLGALVYELKRILASRHCIQWQPRIVPILHRLGIETGPDMVMQAEIERLRDQVGGSEETTSTLVSEEGERLMRISDQADSLKVPDEQHAVAVCSVRAQSPGELASLALAMLSRLKKKFPDPGMALTKVNRVADRALGLEERVKAIRAMGKFGFCDGDGVDVEMDEKGAVGEEATPELEESPYAPTESLTTPLTSIGARNPGLFTKLLLSAVSGSRDEKLDLVRKFFQAQLRTNSTVGIVQLFRAVEAAAMLDTQSLSVEELGTVISSEPEFEKCNFRQFFFDLPSVPPSLLNFLDRLVQGDEPSVRRAALTTLSSLAVARPGVSGECVSRLLGHCCSQNESVRTDALKLLITKVYKPNMDSLLSAQWPYDMKVVCSVKVVDSLKGKVSKLQRLVSQGIEEEAFGRVQTWLAGKADWHQAWPFFVLCSKKPVLVHCLFACIIDSPHSDDLVLPTDLISSFATSLTTLPGELIDRELELLVKEYKAVRSSGKRRKRNELMLPIFSAISNTQRGLTTQLAGAVLAFNK